jgi:hypothetical protein
MSDIQSLDVSDLVKYSNKIKDIGSINKMMAPVYLRDFIEAQDLVGNMLAKAIQADGRAKAKLEQAESIAYLDNAAEYLTSKGIKDTSEARKQYVARDQDVLRTSEEKAKTEALVAFLKNKLSVFRQAHDDCKKIAYGDQHMTPFEGM